MTRLIHEWKRRRPRNNGSLVRFGYAAETTEVPHLPVVFDLRTPSVMDVSRNGHVGVVVDATRQVATDENVLHVGRGRYDAKVSPAVIESVPVDVVDDHPHGGGRQHTMKQNRCAVSHALLGARVATGMIAPPPMLHAVVCVYVYAGPSVVKKNPDKAPFTQDSVRSRMSGHLASKVGSNRCMDSSSRPNAALWTPAGLKRIGAALAKGLMS